MTWSECEQHNLKHYKEVFIVPKYAPKTYGEWHQLLVKMDPNPFVRAFHLKKVDEQWHDSDSSSYDNLKKYVWKNALWAFEFTGRVARHVGDTEMGFVNFRSQIKQTIESAKQPTVQLNF